MNKHKVTGNIALLLTGLIWGLSFVAQRVGMEYIGPFTFNSIRGLLGSLSVLPVIWLIKFIQRDIRSKNERCSQHPELLKGGVHCGVLLFFAMTIQQYCMKYVTAGKAGFISALYLIFVPLIYTFFGKRLGRNVVISIYIAIIGLFLLCYKAETGFEIYDGILLLSAVFYAMHIMVVDHYTKKTNSAKLSCLQFLFVSIFSGILMLVFENPSMNAIYACKVPLFFAGVVTCGIAYTLQIYGQKYTSPVIAALILSLESVFAVAGGLLLLGETMSIRDTVGCFLMISAIFLSQIKLKPHNGNCKY